MSESQHTHNVTDFEPTPEFLARKKRLDDAMHLRKPDRVPVAPLMVHYYPTRAAGITGKDAMYQIEKRYEIWKQTTIKHNWDGVPAGGSLLPVRPLEILGATQVKWPGNGLGDNEPFQWVEGEYMTQDEYDEVLADPNGFAVRKLWPRIFTNLAPISAMTGLSAQPLLFMSSAYTLPGILGGIISQPSLITLLKKALELAEAHEKNTAIESRYHMEMMALGYPILFGAVTFQAFDWISDCLRGLRGTSLDMFQVPEKLLATIEMLTPMTIGGSIAMAEQRKNKGVFIPLHRGADGFMSEEQFARFYWPSLKSLFLGLMEAGLTPIPLFEGNYTSRLKFLQELPPGKVVGHFDQVDRKKAKALIGNVMCFWGNVPASIMCVGTPQQVKDDVKELIDIFGDNGGLIIDSTMGIPDESKPENVQALTEAVHEFGVY